MKLRFVFSILGVVLAIGVGIGLFIVKHEVKTLEAELVSLNKQIKQDQKEIHVLNAEWSHLNNPARLRKLSKKYLNFQTIKPSQITSISSIPFDKKSAEKRFAEKDFDYDTKALDEKMKNLVSMEAVQ